jgi:3-oxoacyl-[acyl-carrier-protein] synthase III
MIENFVFTGYGNSCGKYKITNSDIETAIEKGFLGGFSKEKIAAGSRYKQFLETNPNTSPFDFFAGHIMGFYERHHVAPFPPTKKKLHYAETSLGLAVRAIDEALEDAEIKASEIAAWFVSTVSPHEQAPGIANTIKAYFTEFENQSPCYTLASGCSGFNINLQRATEYFKQNPQAKHVVVAHTETMSSFLRQRIKFVPFVTFGDAAAAVVISRIMDDNKYGLIDIVNMHDLNMLDYVGVDENQNLYMDDSLIKDRAILNIPQAALKCIEKSKMKIEEIDMLVPHQTGNVILYKAAENLGIPREKVYLEGQKRYGNVSGATVPICFSLLNKNNQLRDGMKILSATAGVGGTYGAFTYIVKQKNKKTAANFYKYTDDLKGKTALVLGASGSIGIEVSHELERRGAKLILHGNQNVQKLKSFKNAEIIIADFNNEEEIENLVDYFTGRNIYPDYLINAVSITNDSNAYKIAFKTPVDIIKSLITNIKSCVIQIGTVCEEMPFYDFDMWTSAHRSIHGFLASASGEFLKLGVRTIYFVPGFTQEGLSRNFDEKEKFRFMMKTGQEKYLTPKQIAVEIVKSLYLPKIIDTVNYYENAMIVRRMGYKMEVDV